MTGHPVIPAGPEDVDALSQVIAEAFHDLKAPVRRVGLADCPAPVSLTLERAFYPDHRTIASECLAAVGRSPVELSESPAEESSFKGPY